MSFFFIGVAALIALGFVFPWLFLVYLAYFSWKWFVLKRSNF